MEEIASMTRQNADNSTHAKAMVDENNVIINKVNARMAEMSDAMEEINQRSNETGKIISSIDAIAFQTNLLALNAAVEAARAGEAGAGFAVVADEVRNLAQRAAEAAANTSALIEGTISKVKEGDELAKSTLEAFQENIDNARKTGKLIEEIAMASNEQTLGIDQVTLALQQLDSVTQDNAASAEESAAASEELSAQSEELRRVVDELSTLVGKTAINKNSSASMLPIPLKA
jgi:methyl-accepting chemotaxis protein